MVWPRVWLVRERPVAVPLKPSDVTTDPPAEIIRYRQGDRNARCRRGPEPYRVGGLDVTATRFHDRPGRDGASVSQFTDGPRSIVVNPVSVREI